jgi:hypothetical protein
MYGCRLLICCCLAFFQVYTQCQAQTAYLQPYRVIEGDIAKLIIEHDSKIPSLHALDTSVLELDFEVLETKSRLARVLESNEVFHRMQWTIEILPRHSGNLVIPALQVGDLSTPVLTLEVAPLTPELRSMQNVFIEIQAQPENPYVGQLTQVIIRLLHNIPLVDDSLLEADTEHADFYRNGKDSRYVTTRDGQEFNVLERKIALVARVPGKISFSPATYRGLISPQADSTMRSRRIYRNSEALQLEIRKPPPEFSGSVWLPARQLEVSQQWDEVSGALNVGDSLGLTLTIESWGLPAEALPAGLISVDSGKFNKFNKFKIYADQEIRANRYQGNDLVGRLQQRFVVVFTEPGNIDIPPTMLKWWDVNHDLERVVMLEGKKLSVAYPAVVQTDADELTGLRSKQLSTQGFELASTRNYWIWLVLSGLLLLVCGLSYLVKPVRDRLSLKLESILTMRRDRKALQQACMSNDPSGARRELLKWGRQRWPGDNINGLHQIEARTVSIALLREFVRLDAALYANRDSAWQGRKLWRLLAAEARYQPAGADLPEYSLPNLYPQQDLSIRGVIR